jgi:hypothetical protein
VYHYAQLLSDEEGLAAVPKAPALTIWMVQTEQIIRITNHIRQYIVCCLSVTRANLLMIGCITYRLQDTAGLRGAVAVQQQTLSFQTASP